MDNQLDYIESEDRGYVFNANKYTKAQAVEIIKTEGDLPDITENDIQDGFVKYNGDKDMWFSCSGDEEGAIPALFFLE